MISLNSTAETSPHGLGTLAEFSVSTVATRV